uniref:PIN domain nuclease, a component of toxin-antitoxin system (PIN domain) n=1 Tax=Candidatus Kentrum sp. SD TaxID=2126332 RepID=A0A450Y4A4_9GAMM|nr:MAG: PIN domain nuclease, a component of toxin-antitoxin system (PIN domain) [Candidatus Kentron sp. SD]VFK38585.1 MAG: PIN domain nuclease, a component of toxin-antitoxin system (PIN domain) [Candidatus Kentron sp. SD]
MILLDTCVIIWNDLASDKLTPKARETMENSRGKLMICDISLWEISMLIKKGRLVANDTTSRFMNLLIESRHFHIQGITPEIAELSANLGSEINNDPADRLIAASSILMNAPLVTADRNLRGAAMLETIW